MTRAVLVACIGLTVSATASAATRISSDTSCPSSESISVRLSVLLPAGGPPSASVRAIQSDGQSLRIELAIPGEAKQLRTVPLQGDCEERAEVAALVIASWLDAMPERNIKAPGIPPREWRESRASDGEPDPDDPDRKPIRTSSRALAGAGVFGLSDNHGASGGLVLGAGMPDLVGDFGLSAEASLGWARELSVGQGTSRYWRPTFALHATAQVRSRSWILRVFVGPALGVLSVSGSGYDKNLSATTVTWGVSFGVALVRPWRGNEAWLSLGSMAWPQGRRIVTRSSLPSSYASLPEWEGRLVLGVSWGVHGSRR
jgi:hypothetical protein